MNTEALGRLKSSFVRGAAQVATSSPVVRAASRRLLHWTRSRAYRSACRRCAVDPRVVVFECYAGRAYACSPRALYRAMLVDSRFDDFEYIWVFRPDDVRLLNATRTSGGGAPTDNDARGLALRFGEEALREIECAAVVESGSAAVHDAYARAGTWVSNYILPAHLETRDSQRYLQTWHGTPLKHLGCDIAPDKRSAMFSVAEIHTRYRNEGSRFDWLVSPSPYATQRLGSAFGLDTAQRSSAIIEKGYPRNDALVAPPAARVAAIRRRLGIPEGRRVVLYAPTFRDDRHASGVGYKPVGIADFDALERLLGNGHTVLFRAHYLLAASLDLERHGDFAIDVSAVSDVNDLYLVTDVLVTDYSSVFFDFANLMRPIIFYMPDLERYRDELRGFYLDLAELPGPVVHSTKSLAEEVLASTGPDPARDERLRRFRDTFAPLDDGYSAQRVLEHVFPSR